MKRFHCFFSWIFVARRFDAAREERFQQEAKQRELQRIEEALQTAARRGEAGCPLLSPPFWMALQSFLLLLSLSCLLSAPVPPGDFTCAERLQAVLLKSSHLCEAIVDCLMEMPEN